MARISPQPVRHVVRLFTLATIGIAFVLACSLLFAQGTSGTLTGNVTTDGDALPGVSVTISSPAMQGTRTTVTNTNGAYNFPAIPPGRYTVVFALEGMEPAMRTVSVSLVQSSRVDAAMRVAEMSESITVTASAPSALETRAVSFNVTARAVDDLPIERTLTGALQLAPGVSDQGPGDYPAISGAPSYNNLYLVNGAVVNENLSGQPQDVYIEDAVEETTVLTGNISAEYGRFTGGVISALTKSGGNELSGSSRTSITNDDWTNKTPYAREADKIDKNNYVHEATLGGRIVRDRLWFFLAGRINETTESAQTRATDIPYTFQQEEYRWEGKLTAQITPKHSVVGSYLDREDRQVNRSYGGVVDLDSLTDRTLPYSLAALSYNGILTSDVLVEAQYSERKLAFVGSGSKYTDLIRGTMLRDNTYGYRGNSPTFCGVCDDETRDNEYLVAKGSYFLSTSGMGNHNLVGGVEDFSEFRFANNYQGGSGYRLWGDMLFTDGPTYYFHFPTVGDIWNYQWNPIFQGSQTNHTRTTSAFVNDKWDLNANWSFNIGIRYDRNEGEDQAGVKQADDAGFSHRLGVVYDIFGDGRHRFNIGINSYVSLIDNLTIDRGSSAGAPATFYYAYLGPEINPIGCEIDGTCIPNHDAIQLAFDWYFANVNPDTDFTYASLPGINRQIDGPLESPRMDEISIGYSVQLGDKGLLRADFIDRSWSNFFVQTTNLDTGTVVNDLGTAFDLTLVQNSNDYHNREYRGLQVQGSYRVMDRLIVAGNYTWSELRGTVEGERWAISVDSYPEYRDLEWSAPERYLWQDVRHRVNAWLSYDQPLGDFGNLNLSWLERYHTGLPYYTAGQIVTSYVENPGYLSPPPTVDYYFEDVREYRTKDVHQSDLGINYSLPIGPVEVFLQADILNVFDESAIQDPNGVRTAVYTSFLSRCRQGPNGPNPGARCLAFNPFEEKPVEGIHWQKPSDFGEPISADAYQLPLTFRFSMGLRF